MTAQSKSFLQSVQIPLLVLTGILLYYVFLFFHLPMIAAAFGLSLWLAGAVLQETI